MHTFETKKVNDYTIEITGEISKDLVDKNYEKILREFKREVVLPGFRKGKAPLSFLKKRFAGEIKGQVVEELFQEYYPKVIEEAKIHPVSQPDITKLEVDEGKLLEFAFSLEVIVMDDPHDYLGLEIEVDPSEVEDKEVTDYLSQLQSRHGEMQVVDDRAAKLEDLLILDINAFDGDNEIESLQREKIQIKLGDNMYLPGTEFDKNLEKIEREKTHEFTLDIPEDHTSEEIKGKSIRFQATINEIKQIVLPELNDDFATTLGEYKTLDELKQSIQDELLAQKKRTNKQAAVENLMDKIIENNEIVIPPSLVDDYINDMAERYGQQTGIPMSPEEKKEKYEDMAIKSIKKSILIDKIGKQEEIKVDESEIQGHLNSLREMYGSSAQAVKSLEDQSLVDSIRRNMLDSKVVDFLFEKANKKGYEDEEEKTEEKADDKADDKKADEKKDSKPKPTKKDPKTGKKSAAKKKDEAAVKKEKASDESAKDEDSDEEKQEEDK